ncbi:MAG: hypothetical protein H6506_01745 [Calditrichaeota bacterium]|nr:hypothetical protein [Calditrichota bacterium]MCB9391354.1 hypothetical protein [Calditrichota bacterium]
MFGPVREGVFYFNRKEFERGLGVKVWYLGEGIKRGWQVTPWREGRASGMTFPLSPDVWDYLYSEEELSAGLPRRTGEHVREHMGFTK